MITKFDSLYAGHADMEDIGYGGTAVNSRVYSNEHLVTVLEKTRSPVLEKPFDSDELLRVVERLVAERSAPSPSGG